MTYSSNDGHCHDSHSQARWNEIDTYSTLTLASGARTQCPSPSQVLDGRQPETILSSWGPCSAARAVGSAASTASHSASVRREKVPSVQTQPQVHPADDCEPCVRCRLFFMLRGSFCLFCCAVLSRFFLSSVPSPTKSPIRE